MVAFAGGAFGAALGGYPAFSLAGFLVVAGETVKVADQAGVAVGPVNQATAGTTGITASLGLGPALGPHVAFGGGVAAAAYAARRGVVDEDYLGYHPAKNVTESLGARPDVLVAGGAFGVVGLLLARGSAALNLPWYPVAFGIVGSAFLHRIAFGYPLVGDVDANVLDMTPFERGDRRAPRTHAVSSVAVGGVSRVAEIRGGRAKAGDSADSGGENADDTTIAGEGNAGGENAPTDPPHPRFEVEPWLPHQYRWGDVAVLGFAVGVFGAFAVYTTGSVFLAFGIAAASLAFLCLGLERMPVTYHMALPASVAVVGLAGGANPAILDGTLTPTELQTSVGLLPALLVGGVFGLIAGLAGELAQRVLYAHADTHLDPPAAGIVLTTALLALLDLLGLFVQNAIPTP